MIPLNLKTLTIAGTVLLSLLLIFFLGSTLYIEMQVKNACTMARIRNQQNDITALISVIQNEGECTKNKSYALWALGQLGNKEALPFLNDKFGHLKADDICTYEAHFAIKKLEKNKYNLPKMLWRWAWK